MSQSQGQGSGKPTSEEEQNPANQSSQKQASSPTAVEQMSPYGGVLQVKRKGRKGTRN